MRSYRVSWHIDVEAHDAEDAACQAWQAVREPDSTACVFDVTERGEGKLTEVIDLRERGRVA